MSKTETMTKLNAIRQMPSTSVDEMDAKVEALMPIMGQALADLARCIELTAENERLAGELEEAKAALGLVQ